MTVVADHSATMDNANETNCGKAENPSGRSADSKRRGQTTGTLRVRFYEDAQAPYGCGCKFCTKPILDFLIGSTSEEMAERSSMEVVQLQHTVDL